MPASWVTSSRTAMRSPARWAGRRIRCAICRARTQGEDVDADVVLGPVERRGGRHRVRVFHLAEGEFGFGPGPVAGGDFGRGPVVVAGDQHVFAEDLLFQDGARILVDAPGQAEALGLIAGWLPGDDPAHPGVMGDL